MNRKQAKELLPIIQAFAEGKTVQTIDKNGEWINCLYINFEFNSSPNSYRIKPEPMYRPFKDAEECWQEMLKHKPFGWVEALHGHFHITGITNAGVNCGVSDNWLDYEYMVEHYKFIDGTPFGIKEE